MNDFGFQSRSLQPEPSSRMPQRPPRRGRRSSGFRGRVNAVLEMVIAWIVKPRTRREKKLMALQIFGGLAGCGFLFLFALWLTLPDIDDPETLFASESSVILDKNDIELYRLFSEEDRTYVPMSSISDYIENATIAIEDERFLERGCFDVVGFTRAVLSQFFPSFFVRSGGSTLTQQFAGNAMVGRQRSVVRKVREMMLACELESRYTKEQLLELYLNWIPYGETSYGIEQASRNYFGTSASGITLPQAATLAAIVQRPSYFSPYGSHAFTSLSESAVEAIENGDITSRSDIDEDDITIGLVGKWFGTGSTKIYVGGRSDQVLKNMLNLGMITQTEHDDAVRAFGTLEFSRARSSIRAPHFVLWVKDQASKLLESLDEGLLEKGGFRIKTTLDWRLQKIAEEEMARQKESLATRYEAHNASLLSIDPSTREILAYVGNIDFDDDEHEGKVDMVQAPRQPGSSFKPFAYAAAFEKGYGPATVMYDIPTRFGNDTPQNYEGGYEGLMTMRTALAHSRNIPAAKTYFMAGEEGFILPFIENLGVTTPMREYRKFKMQNKDFSYGWPLALGAAEIPLYEMTQGYAVFADGGMYKPLVSILEIRDRQNNLLYKAKPEEGREVLDPRIAAQITSILSDNEARPENPFWRSQLSVSGYQAAAKTGTSNKCLERNPKDECIKRRPESNWTMGYTPILLTGVWVGNATSEPLTNSADGLTTAGTIWNRFMNRSHAILKGSPQTFALPAGLSQPQVSLLSGYLPSECTPVEKRRSDLFFTERVPTKGDTACAMLTVDKVTGLLASDKCPADAREQKAFFIPQSELPMWESDVISWANGGSGTQLPLPLAPTEECDSALTPGRGDRPTVDILSPESGSNVEYPIFDVALNIQTNSTIKEIRFEVDGRPIRTEEGAIEQVTLRMPRTIEESGNHKLTVTIMNEYFTEDTDTVNFSFGPSDPRTRPNDVIDEPSDSDANSSSISE